LSVRDRVALHEARVDSLSMRGHICGEPSACLLALDGDEALGYLLAQPAYAQNPIEPHVPAGTPPPNADALFLHDLVIAPHARGRGIAHWLIESAFQQAYQAGLSYAASVAMPVSRKFLLRFGFRPAMHLLEPEAQRRVAGNGLRAEYMLRSLGRPPARFG
jgi:GNAT superfamily N-acetyltransferase